MLSCFGGGWGDFVLEFCKTSDRVNMICFAQFFGHRSNPIIFSCTNKEPTQSGGFFICGGERGIRTLGTVLAFTRFPIVRLRPAQPSLHNGVSSLDFYIISQKYKKSSPFLKKYSLFFAFFQKIIKISLKKFKKGIDISFSLCYNINVP